MTDLAVAGAAETARPVREGEVSAVDVLPAALVRIDDEPTLLPLSAQLEQTRPWPTVAA